MLDVLRQYAIKMDALRVKFSHNRELLKSHTAIAFIDYITTARSPMGERTWLVLKLLSNVLHRKIGKRIWHESFCFLILNCNFQDPNFAPFHNWKKRSNRKQVLEIVIFTFFVVFCFHWNRCFLSHVQDFFCLDNENTLNLSSMSPDEVVILDLDPADVVVKQELEQGEWV